MPEEESDGSVNETQNAADSLQRKRGKRDWRRFLRRLRHRDGGALSEGNQVEVYFWGDPAYDAMRAAIREARESIHLEIYIFMADAVGRSFAELLAARAEDGVDVRVIYDSFGSHRAGKKFFEEMRRRGVKVAEFRPFAPWRLFGRNHRKLLVVDRRVAFTGGVNISDSYSERESGETAWRDTHLRVEGPAARDCDVLFRETWRVVTKEVLPEPAVPRDVAQASSERACSCCTCLVVGSRGMKRRRVMRRLFSVHIGRARKAIQLTVPYFSPPWRLERAMEKARERGVEIDLLVPEFTDVPIADWIRERLLPVYRQMGVTIREYQRAVLHAKTMVVDGELAVVGSTNYDYLSIAMNLELSIVVYDQSFADLLLEQHQQDLARSSALDLRRPDARKWWQRLLARLGAFLVRRL